MKILGIESSSLVASVALVTDEVLTAEYTVDFKKTHSQTLLPMVDEVVKMVGLDLNAIDGIAVAGGPGSFTGLRIGAATAKGLGLALNKPLIHVPTVEAMAYNLWGSAGLICPIMDARRRQVYTGLYRMEGMAEENAAAEAMPGAGAKAAPPMQTVMAQTAMDAEDLCRLLNERGEAVTFLGDGVPVYRELFEEKLTVPHAYAPAHLNRQRAGAVAFLGVQAMEHGGRFGGSFVVSSDDFEPDYLRKPQAEREREAKLSPDGVDGRLFGDAGVTPREGA